jgi:hypothetical protein
MNKVIIVAILGAIAGLEAQAANYITVDFSSGYTIGNLAGLTQNAAGQNDWKQTSTSAATPIQVNASGQAVIGSSGQDIYKAFTSSISKVDGSSFYLKARFAVTETTTTGDYFLHVSPTAGDASNFLGRIGAKLLTAGSSQYVLGIQSTSGTCSAMTYGTTLLDKNTFYDVVLEWNSVTGTLNDTFNLFINPLTDVRANLTSYVSANWLSTTTAEPTTIAAVNLRQGGAGNNTTALISSISAGNTLGDVGVVPEPSTSGLLIFGVAALLGVRSFRRMHS